MRRPPAGRPIPIAKSRGGRVVLLDYSNAVLVTRPQAALNHDRAHDRPADSVTPHEVPMLVAAYGFVEVIESFLAATCKPHGHAYRTVPGETPVGEIRAGRPSEPAPCPSSSMTMPRCGERSTKLITADQRLIDRLAGTQWDGVAVNLESIAIG